MAVSLPKLNRLWRHVRREFIQRSLPHGLLGPGYLWPGKIPLIRLHRRFWWMSGQRWPRLVWLIVEAGLWLRWQFWHAVPACVRITRKLGPAVKTQEGIPVHTQAWRIWKLALLWCIPPRDSYRYRLYRNPALALDYVYDHEIQAYHAWRSEGLGFTPASRQLLQDKARFAERMRVHGIPVVPTLAHLPRDATDWVSLRDSLRHAGRVFCKMNSGNQGRGAFAAWQTPEGLAGRRFTGQPLPDTAAVESAWQQLLRLDDALVQPCLANHPALASLAFNGEAITVRFISQWVDGGEGQAPTRLSCFSAALETPAGLGANGQIFYAIHPIQPDTGELSAPVAPLLSNPETQAALARVAQEAAKCRVLPGWRTLVEASEAAHRIFPDVRAIAWDWVLTPAGPVLLEGNVGWGLAMPQIMRERGSLDGFNNRNLDFRYAGNSGSW